MFYVVYRTINLVNGKFYIGCHKTKNLSDGYIGSGKRLKLAIKKYGRENFQSTIVKLLDNEKDMFSYEKKLVAKCKDDPHCYNIAAGGKGGWSHVKWQGKKHNESSKKKIGAANSKIQKGKGNSQFGTCWVSNDDLKLVKKIRLEDLDAFIATGWKRARSVYGMSSG